MWAYVWILIFLIFGAFVIGNCEAEDTLLHRVKRAPIVEKNNTKLLGNVTLAKQGDASSNASSTVGKEVSKPKLEPDLKNLGVDLKTAISEMRRLQTPVLRVSRHYSVAATPASDDKTCKSRHQKKRNAEKDAHNDTEKGRIFFTADAGKEHVDLHGLHKLHPRTHSSFESFGDREKLFELLTGETEISNGRPKHLGDLKQHHETGKNLHFHGKLKRNAKNEMTRHHKDERDYESQLSNYATVKDSPIIKLTKMLINLEEADDPSHVQNAEESITPDMIFKPFGIDSDEASIVAPTDFFLNTLTQEFALSPATLNEFPLPVVPNSASLKGLSSDADSAIATNKEENDNEEYEMTCPVHFKKDIKNGANDGLVEVCSCHLYRKKKQIA